MGGGRWVWGSVGRRLGVLLRLEGTLSDPILCATVPAVAVGLEYAGRDQDGETKPAGLALTETLAVLVSLLFSPFISREPQGTHGVTPPQGPPAKLSYSAADSIPLPASHTTSFPRKDIYLWPCPERGLLPTQASFLVCQWEAGLVRCLHLFLIAKCKSRSPASPTFSPCSVRISQVCSILLKTPLTHGVRDRGHGTPTSPKVERRIQLPKEAV